MIVGKASYTWRIVNAIVTLHGFSAGTAILNITSTKEHGNHVSIWVSPEELKQIANQFLAVADRACEEM